MSGWHPSGNLFLLLSKTDTFDEFNRLLKLGRIRIRVTPTLSERPFTQTLQLDNGAIQIKSGQTTVRVWVDANNPVIQVDMQSSTPVRAEVKTEIWRTVPRKLDRISGPEKEVHSAYGNNPDKNRVNPDSVLPHRSGQIAWCHRNIESQWQANLKLTGLETEIAHGTDPILGRTFGAIVRGKNLRAVSDTAMKSIRPEKLQTIQIFPLTIIAESETDWLKAVEKQAGLIHAN